jgi:glycosyltransferase involved in cell wall biosynthesis
MKIGLLIAFAGRNCGGPEVGEREIVRELSAAAPQHEYHLYCLDRRAPDIIDLQGDNIIYHLLEPSVRVVSMLTSLPLAIKRTRPDVFHAPVIPPPFCPRDMIMSMPCSATVRHPEFYPPLIRMRLKFLLHRAIPKAGRVICVSEHVREVVLEEFHVSADRLPVIYPGASRLFRPIAESEKRAFVEEKHAIRYPYFLFCGRWEQRKNVVRTLEAFARFKRESHSEHKLVFTGERTWASEKADAIIAHLGIQNEIVDLGKTAVDELPYLYGAADALVFASLWEGFGMPIVEAMACGTPVITSNLAAMPETAGNAALLVNPYSVEEIAAAMHRIVSDANLRVLLRERGLQRAPLFTWEKTARDILDLYEQVAGDRRRKTAVLSQ